MAKYRKKPIIVEAEVYKLGMEDGFCVEDYLPTEVYNNRENLECFESNIVSKTIKNKILYPYIKTLEGRHFISKGDYIITGIKGERYPCKVDIFEETYELIEEQKNKLKCNIICNIYNDYRCCKECTNKKLNDCEPCGYFDMEIECPHIDKS